MTQKEGGVLNYEDLIALIRRMVEANTLDEETAKKLLERIIEILERKGTGDSQKESR